MKRSKLIAAYRVGLFTALVSATALTAFFIQPGEAAAKDLGPYGKVTIDGRIRYEKVDDAARDRDGIAKTARVRLGYQTPEWNGLYAFGEIESIRHLGATSFDDGLNGKTEFGRISDPELNALNQLYVHYNYAPDSMLRVGRQGLAFDNQRFVAWSKTRQNDSTHDALFLQYTPVEDLTLKYAHSIGLHRFSGRRSTAGNFEGNSNLVNAHYDWQYGLGVSVYSYWINFDGVPVEQDQSSRTHGLRLTWTPGEEEGKEDSWQPLAAIEYAHQRDFGHSDLSYSENYAMLEAGVQKGGMKFTAAVERLGGDGTEAMQTPFGSGHNLTGWSDKFSTTPDDGLRDIRAGFVVPYELPWKGQSVEFAGQYHVLTSDDGDIDFGTETDLMLTYKPAKDHAISLKYADYKADDFSSDTDKVWITYDFKF